MSEIDEAVRQVDGDSWVIGEKFHHHDHSYCVDADIKQLPPTIALPEGGHVHQIYNKKVSAVWSFGEALLKVKKIENPRQTNEAEVLRWLATRDLNCAVPRVLFDTIINETTYLLITRVPGQRLDDVWRTLDEHVRKQYVDKAAELIQTLALTTSPAMTGVDGREVADSWLNPLTKDYTTDLLAICKNMGMQIDEFCFSHGDIGPTNIIVDQGEFGVIDWEMAGFYPREWIRTKFAVSYGLDFEWNDVDSEDRSLRQWRDQVEHALSVRGFPEATQAWRELWRERLRAFQCEQ